MFWVILPIEHTSDPLGTLLPTARESVGSAHLAPTAWLPLDILYKAAAVCWSAETFRTKEGIWMIPPTLPLISRHVDSLLILTLPPEFQFRTENFHPSNPSTLAHPIQIFIRMSPTIRPSSTWRAMETSAIEIEKLGNPCFFRTPFTFSSCLISKNE